jgi:F420-dependent oxidoreductase-like protein
VPQRIAAYAEPVSGSIGEAIERARIADELGYDSVWVSQIADSEDGATVLAAHACNTMRVGLGIAAITIHSRHPTSAVQLAATIDALSGGRFRLGLGVGHELTVEWMWGLTRGRPLQAMREYLTIVRGALRTGTVNFTGQRFTARWRYSGQRRPGIPILIGALGPRMLELAGELADGVLLWLCSPRYVREHVLPHVRAGRDRASLPMDGFEIQVPIFASVTLDRERGRDYIRKLLATYAKLPPYRRMLDASGFAEELASGRVSEATIAQLSGIGSEDDVRTIIRDYREAGCTLPTIAPLPMHEGAADFETLLRAAAG